MSWWRFDINVEMCSKLSKSPFPKKLGTPDKKKYGFNFDGVLINPGKIPHVTGQAKTGQSANGKIYGSPFEEPQSTTGQNVRSSTKPNFSGLLQHGKS